MRKLIVIGATYFPLGFYAVWSAQWPVHRSSSPTLWEVQVPQISLWAEVITKWNIFSFHFPSHCERRPPWVSPARERRFYLGVRPVPSVHYAKCPAYYAGRPLNCDWFSAAFRVVQCGWQGASHHLDLSGTKTGATPLAAVPNEIGVQPVRPLTGNVCSLASLWPDKQQQKIHPIRFQLYWIGTGRKLAIGDWPLASLYSFRASFFPFRLGHRRKMMKFPVVTRQDVEQWWMKNALWQLLPFDDCYYDDDYLLRRPLFGPARGLPRFFGTNNKRKYLLFAQKPSDNDVGENKNKNINT